MLMMGRKIIENVPTSPSWKFEEPTDNEDIFLPDVKGHATGKFGVNIIPHSPLLGTLNEQLEQEYYSRATVGCYVIPRFFGSSAESVGQN